MKALFMAVLASLAHVLIAGAADYRLKATLDGQVVDWTSDASYEGGSAPADPSTAVVYVADGITVKIDDSTIGDASTLFRILPGTNSVVEVDISETQSLACAVTQVNSSGGRLHNATFRKKGVGLLKLLSCGQVLKNMKDQSYDYNIHMDIQAGGVELPPQAPSFYRSSYGNVNVESGATLYLTTGSADLRYETWVRMLTGGGDVTNAPLADASADVANLTFIMPQYQAAVPCEFSGRLLGKIRYYGAANIALTGTDSTASGLPLIYNHGLSPDAGTVWLSKLGMKGQPSSIGRSSTISFQEKGGRIVYLGTGETSDKAITLSHSTVDATAALNCGEIDGGPFGGLELAGAVKMADGYRLEGTLILSGTNANPCAISGTVPWTIVDRTEKDGKFFTNRVYVVKRGSGEWRIGHSYENHGISGVAVEEGTLSFDSIAEVGVSCSFGKGIIGGTANFYQDHPGLYDPAICVPYAFKLGGAEHEAVFKYLGTSLNACSTRPAVIAGKARIVTDAGALDFSGVSPYDASGEKVLTLAGTSTAGSRLSNVTNDANGVLSVVKEGSGTWTLSGEQAFGGDLSVKEGTLVVQGAKIPFSWFRVQLKSNFSRDPETDAAIAASYQTDANLKYAFALYSMAFYDKDGNRLDPKITSFNATHSDLKVGEVAYFDSKYPDLTWNYKGKASGPLNLFNNSTNTYWAAYRKEPNGNCSCQSPRSKVPDSKIQLDVRFPENTSVDSIDFCSLFDYVEAGGGWAGNIREFNVQGSLDGENWVNLFDQDVSKDKADCKAGCWHSDGTPMDAEHDQVRHGYVFDRNGVSSGAEHVLDGVRSIAVAPGAKLIYQGATPLEIDTFKVVYPGSGELSNFAFAESGALEIVGVPDEGKVELVGDFSKIDGFASVGSWDLTVNGRSGRYTLSVAGGKMTLLKKGLVLIVR